MSKPPLAIGIGNPDRGDDGAGVLAVRVLRSVRALERTDCSDLIDLWEDETDVTIIDAMRSGNAPGTVMRFDATSDPLPVRAFPSTHSFGLAETVELARTLGRLPQVLRIYGIEASEFTPGAPLSDPVREAAAAVALEIDEANS